MNNEVAHLINQLQLIPHPEGGYFRETYRSDGIIPQNALPQKFAGDRNYQTAIYYLLQSGDFSAFHRINSDELWHFYEGQSLEIFVLKPAQGLHIIRLGKNLNEGEQFQAIVEAGVWFASRPVKSESETYSLVGCTVAPGFDFSDFEMAERAALVREYPQHSEIIEQLTRQ